MDIYSSKEQFEKIAHYLTAYMQIPFFQDDTIPGKVMEKIISLVRNGKQLSTYDYVDVIKDDVGWQVKSTKSDTPITWKRAKIATSNDLIKQSEESNTGCQKLGDAIIDFCNAHALHSTRKYDLTKIGYSRLIMFPDNNAIYFEREICTNYNTNIFDKTNYTWHWSTPKKTKAKEQLPALHGTDKRTGKKAFAWHGRGENQLHFSGEGEWWPKIKMPSKLGEIKFSDDGHAMAFKLPSSKVPWEDLVAFLNKGS